MGITSGWSPQDGYSLRVPPSLDRQSCDTAYPHQVGNYFAHAKCVNAAVENVAIPRARYPDLVRLQEQSPLKHSAQTDSGVFPVSGAARKMAEVDEMVTRIEHARSSGHATVPDQLLNRIEAMLQK